MVLLFFTSFSKLKTIFSDDPHFASPAFSSGHHFETATKEALHSRQQRQDVHVPSEGSRGLEAGRESYAVLQPGQLATDQRPRNFSTEFGNPG